MRRQLVHENVLIGHQRVLHGFLLDLVGLRHEHLDDDEDDEREQQRLQQFEDTAQRSALHKIASIGAVLSSCPVSHLDRLAWLKSGRFLRLLAPIAGLALVVGVIYNATTVDRMPPTFQIRLSATAPDGNLAHDAELGERRLQRAGAPRNGRGGLLGQARRAGILPLAGRHADLHPVGQAAAVVDLHGRGSRPASRTSPAMPRARAKELTFTTVGPPSVVSVGAGRKGRGDPDRLRDRSHLRSAHGAPEGPRRPAHRAGGQLPGHLERPDSDDPAHDPAGLLDGLLRQDRRSGGGHRRHAPAGLHLDLQDRSTWVSTRPRWSRPPTPSGSACERRSPSSSTARSIPLRSLARSGWIPEVGGSVRISTPVLETAPPPTPPSATTPNAGAHTRR